MDWLFSYLPESVTVWLWPTVVTLGLWVPTLVMFYLTRKRP